MSTHIMEYLNDTFRGLTQDLSLKGSGRTTKMLEDVMTTIKAKKPTQRMTIIIVLPVLLHEKTVIPMFVDLLRNAGFDPHRSLSLCIALEDTVKIYITSVEQLKSNTQNGKYAGCYPDPIRFLDHTTEEMIIAQGLQRIEQKLQILKNGKYI